MLRLFSRKPSVYAGLAVCAKRLCLVTLKKTRKNVAIESVATCPLPPDPLLWADALSDLVLSTGTGCRMAALALPAREVMTKRIRVPDYLTSLEQAEDIRSNLSYYLPGIPDQIYFDFIPLEKEGQDRALQCRVVRAEPVDTWCRYAKRAGLTIEVVDVDVLAIARGVRAIASSSNDQDRLKKALEVHGGLPVVSFDVAGNALLSELMVAYGLAWRGFSG
ncbi:MAG TPA: pilus assembly protein PilM [Gammaproteobacteria bacterium]|nr:pilus assembly protein PilM [Gammaproteobacteria bacterium]